MSRTVINVELMIDQITDQSIVYFRVQEPFGLPGGADSHRLPVTASDPPFAALTALAANGAQPGLVRVAGVALHDGLVTHPGFQHAINQAVFGATAEPQPIYVQTSAIASEGMPWEILYHPQKEFLSLASDWPIARITGSRQSGELNRIYQGQLIVAAVLGAKDVDALPEWEALVGSLSKIPCQLCVFVAQTDLYNHIADLELGWVTVEMIPDTEAALVDRLTAIKPQVLHTFCHGSSNGYLEIANKSTWDLGREPFYLSQEDLRVLKDSLWLAVLNCCDGAAATDTHSLAYLLVEAGVPAAVGMREPVDKSDASIFSRAFYEQLASTLGGALIPGKRVPVDWAALMMPARRALCRRHGNKIADVARDHKEWTLPVLYRRPEELVIEVPASQLSGVAADELFAQLDTLRTFRASLHPSTPVAKVKALDALIRKLETQLTPDR